MLTSFVPAYIIYLISYVSIRYTHIHTLVLVRFLKVLDGVISEGHELVLDVGVVLEKLEESLGHDVVHVRPDVRPTQLKKTKVHFKRIFSIVSICISYFLSNREVRLRETKRNYPAALF